MDLCHMSFSIEFLQRARVREELKFKKLLILYIRTLNERIDFLLKPNLEDLHRYLKNLAMGLEDPNMFYFELSEEELQIFRRDRPGEQFAVIRMQVDY